MKYLKFTLIGAAAISFVLSTSCATTRGFGQDLQKVGNKLENEADATGGASPTRSTVPIRPVAPPPTTYTTAPPAY